MPLTRAGPGYTRPYDGGMRYLDYAATTPVLDEVVEAMLPFLRGTFGNPSSVYAVGRDAKKGLEEARERMAGAIGAAPGEIIFTAGGTEADNLALKGAAFRARAMRSTCNHVITTAAEHHAVLHAAEWLEKQGFRVTFLPVDAEGVVDLDALSAALGPETVLVSIMLANNEVGIVGTIDRVKVNGAGAPRVPGTVNVCIDGVEGESLLLMLDSNGVAASSGSACTSGSLEPSHVLMAMGVRPELAHGSLRLSLGRATTDEDVDAVLEVLPAVVDRLRSIAPSLSPKSSAAAKVAAGGTPASA